jgi:hypothetical protein
MRFLVVSRRIFLLLKEALPGRAAIQIFWRGGWDCTIGPLIGKT